MSDVLAMIRTGLRCGLVLVPTLALFPFALLSRALDRWGGAGGARGALRLGAWVQGCWARGTLAALGVRLQVDGRPPRGAYLIVANHVSYLDILVLATLFPSRFVAKSEIAHWPLVGVLGRSVGTLFIRQSRRRDVVRVGDEIARTLECGLSVCVFPEGAASNGAEVHRFHSSLLQPAALRALPCLPVALRYATPGADATPRVTVAWWGDMPLVGHLRRLVALPRVHASARWAAARTGSERKALAQGLQADVTRLFEPLEEGPLPAAGPLPTEGPASVDPAVPPGGEPAARASENP